MKKYVVDTNCLLSYVTDRNPEQQEEVSHYFEDATNSKLQLVILSSVLVEFVYVLSAVYNAEDVKTAELLYALYKTPGITVESYCNLPAILHIWPNKMQDYGDAVLAAYAGDNRVPVITFDKIFQKQLERYKIAVEKPL